MNSEISIIIMILTGIGLAMDALAVSISCGLSCRKLKSTLPVALKVGLTFGFFQAMMTFLGWVVGLSFKDVITSYDHWIAFILLGLIGGKMIYESRGEDGCSIAFDSLKVLLYLAVATSIDALAIGVSFSVLNMASQTITLTSVIIGIITLIFCFSGTYIGSKVGCNPKFKSRVDILGGTILVVLGLKILIEHTMMG